LSVKGKLAGMRHRNSCYVIRIVIVFIVVLLQGCGEKKLSPIPASGTILAFGDSLTVGYGVAQQNSYPSVLSELSGRRVINAGVSGEVTAEGLLRLPETLEQTQPDLLILLEGGNDILRNKGQAAAKKNLASMIEVAQSLGVEVVLIGVPVKSLFSDTAPFYRELAEQYQLVFEDELIADLMRNRSYKSDAIHFNQQGYRLMAESIYELLTDNGAL